MTYYTKAEKEAYKAGCRKAELMRHDTIATLMKRIEELAKQVDEQCERANELETVAAMRGDALVSSRQINEQLNEERNACMLKMDEMRAKIVTLREELTASREVSRRHLSEKHEKIAQHNNERNQWQEVCDAKNKAIDELNARYKALETLQASTAQINVSLIEERDELYGKLNARVVDPVRRISELLEANSKLVERLQASENERRRIERILSAFDPATLYVGHSGNVWPKDVIRPDLVHDEVDMTSNRVDVGGEPSQALYIQQFGRAYRPFNGDKNSPTFKAGYDAGLHDSKLERQTFYEDGKRDGRAEGYSDGYKNGYSIGYGEGQRN